MVHWRPQVKTTCVEGGISLTGNLATVQLWESMLDLLMCGQGRLELDMDEQVGNRCEGQ